MSDTAISIRNLYKIFGSDPNEAMKHVRKGMEKNELLERATSEKRNDTNEE